MGAPRTAFDADYGTGQGRIAPAGWVPPDGAFVMQLGHDLPNVRRFLAAGDAVSVGQSFDADGVRKLRFRARFRAPASMPSGWAWSFTASIDGHVHATRPLARTAEAFDLALATQLDATQTSPNAVAFTLTLSGPSSTFAEVELPGVWIDNLVPDPIGAAFEVYSRNPEPAETGIPHAAPIVFTVAEMTGIVGAPLIASINVYVNDVLAVSAGGIFGNGFTGSVVEVWTSFGGAVYSITPPALFTSLEVVTVRVDGGALFTPIAWSFTAADTTGPNLLAASAPTEITVEAVFDKAMNAGDLAALASYAIALVAGAPAVTPVVVGVAALSDRSALLTLDRIMTRGATYRLTAAAGMVDTFGNVLVGRTAIFLGYRWPVPAGRRTDLWSRLPEVVRAMDTGGDHFRFIAVLQELLDVYYGLADRVLDIIDPDFAPEPWVDLMLVDLGNPFDFLDLSETEKRILAQTLVAIYRTKGTGPGIVSTVQFFLGISVAIRVYAWAPYPIGQAIIGQTFVLGGDTQADVYTFQVVLSDFLTATQRKNLRAIVEYMRVAEEHWVLVEPTPPGTVQHWQIGFSLLGSESTLH